MNAQDNILIYKCQPKSSEVKVYYKPGNFDAYTVIFHNQFVYGVSSDPEHPLGVQSYIGERPRFNTDILGRWLTWDEVPDSLKRWIIKKLKEGK